MKMTKLIPGCAVLAAGLFGTAAASAASVTQCGPNVCYTYDDAQVAVALTGLPTLVGDAMQFLPPSFAAQSTGGAGWVETGGPAGGTFLFNRVYTVMAGDEITSFSVSEEFDYSIINGGQVEAALYTLAVSNVLGYVGESTSTSQTFSATGDSGGYQVNSVIAQLYPATAFAGPATDMSVVIQNTVRAYTGAAGEDASIQKKFTLVANTVMNSEIVPVPAAVWLLGSAIGCLGLLRRRSRWR